MALRMNQNDMATPCGKIRKEEYLTSETWKLLAVRLVYLVHTFSVQLVSQYQLSTYADFCRTYT